jgi:hypothetical protein
LFLDILNVHHYVYTDSWFVEDYNQYEEARYYKKIDLMLDEFIALEAVVNVGANWDFIKKRMEQIYRKKDDYRSMLDELWYEFVSGAEEEEEEEEEWNRKCNMENRISDMV